jgi:hypothetical protein
VIDLGSGEFVIESEEDSIPFVPDDPRRFAEGTQGEPESIPGRVSDHFEIRTGPPPKPLTVVAFWALAALTTALGIWGLISLL